MNWSDTRLRTRIVLLKIEKEAQSLYKEGILSKEQYQKYLEEIISEQDKVLDNEPSHGYKTHTTTRGGKL